MGHGRQEPKILIAGSGNLLLRDDGVGLHFIRELRKDPQTGVLAPEILILGVEPKIIEFGLELSPQVGAALPTVVQWVKEQIYSRRFQPGSLNRFPSPTRSSRSVSGISRHLKSLKSLY